MGKTRTSVRTLADGTKVRHYPPDETHPEGKMVRIDPRSPVKERIKAARESLKRHHETFKAEHHHKVRFKKALEAEGGLPKDKSSL